MSKLVKVYESLSLRVQGLLPRQCPRDEVLDDVWTVTENTEEDEDEELNTTDPSDFMGWFFLKTK